MITEENVKYRLFSCQNGNGCHCLYVKQYRIREYQSGKIHPPLRDTLPFWFVITSPAIGIFAGLLLAWLLGRF